MGKRWLLTVVALVLAVSGTTATAFALTGGLQAPDASPESGNDAARDDDASNVSPPALGMCIADAPGCNDMIILPVGDDYNGGVTDGDPADEGWAEPGGVLVPQDPAVVTPGGGVDPQECSTMDDGNACEDLAIGAASKDLVQRLGIGPAGVQLVSVESVEWPDSSLGNPQQGYDYAQVITPGYRIVLSADGATYTYHTDLHANVTLVG